MRISTTTIESFRLFMQPEQEWMTEESLRDTVYGAFVPNEKVLLGQAFGAVIETPDAFKVSGGYLYKGRDHEQFFDDDTMQPALDLFDRHGLFETKAQKAYGPHDVVAKADYHYGLEIGETKTTLSTFDVDKYLESCQWKFLLDILGGNRVTYRVFCLEFNEGVVGLKDVHQFHVYPYPRLHHDCCELVDQFVSFVTAKGWADVLNERQRAAGGA